MRYPFIVPDLPPLAALIPSLENIWACKIFSNNGEYVRRLEEAAAKFYAHDPTCVVSCCNATVGLILAIKAVRWNPQQRVLVPSFTFPATIQALKWNRLSYSFIDIDFITWAAGLDVSYNYRYHNQLVTLPYGASVSPLGEASSTIIDAAASFGSSCVKSILDKAEATVFSLHATKPLGVGEGSLVFFREKKTAERFRALCNFGFTKERDVLDGGMNGKMSEVAAAIGLLQLQRFEEFAQKRRQVASWYHKYLSTHAGLFFSHICEEHLWQCIPILLSVGGSNRDRVREILEKEHEIGTRSYYEPMHLMSSEYYSQLSNTEFVAAHVLALPIYNTMLESDVLTIAQALDTTLKQVSNE